MSKPVKFVWQTALLTVAGLTLWHIPAWRALCRTPTTAVGQIYTNTLPRGQMRYSFQVEGKTWLGKGSKYQPDGTLVDPDKPIEVFYAPSDPSINQIRRPSAGDWWRHALAYFFFYGLFIVTMVVGVIQLLLQKLFESTPCD